MTVGCGGVRVDEKNELNSRTGDLPKTRGGRRCALANGPLYAHLFLLQDGEVLLQRRQLRAKQRLRPTGWDPSTNVSTDLRGVLPDRREQPVRRGAAAPRAGPASADHRAGVVRQHDQTGAVSRRWRSRTSIARTSRLRLRRSPGGPRGMHRAHPASRPHQCRQRRRDDGGVTRRREALVSEIYTSGPRGRYRPVEEA